MGGVASETDDVLAVAQAIIRRNPNVPDPADGMDPERMDAAPFLRKVAFQAEFDGGRGISAGVQS